MRILITGASGQLGAYLIEALLETHHEIIAWSGTETGQRWGVPFIPVDLTNLIEIEKALDASQPDGIIHAAALSATEAVRQQPIVAQSLNIDATDRIAGWADHRGRPLVFTSTDLVFDGSLAWNREDQPASPLLAYGRSKLEAEGRVLQTSTGIVARLSLLFGPTKCGRPYFFDRSLESMRQGYPQSFFNDEYRTPLDLGTAALILIRLLESRQNGLFHVAGAERMSRFELMLRTVSSLCLDTGLVLPISRTEVSLPEPRPQDVSLDTTRLLAAFPELNRPSIEELMSRIS